MSNCITVGNNLIVGLAVGIVVGILVGIAIREFLGDKKISITRDDSGRIVEGVVRYV